MSQVFAYRNERIAEEFEFVKELELEYFLMGNLNILSTGNNDVHFLNHQVFSQYGRGKKSGRYDLLVAFREEETEEWVIRIVELKLHASNKVPADQIASYLTNWENDNVRKQKVSEWFSSSTNIKDAAQIKKVIDTPRGMLVAQSFAPEILGKVVKFNEENPNTGISIVKMNRYVVIKQNSSEYLLVVNTLLTDKPTERATRMAYSFQNLIDAGLLGQDEHIYFQAGNHRYEATPGPIHDPEKKKPSNCPDAGIVGSYLWQCSHCRRGSRLIFRCSKKRGGSTRKGNTDGACGHERWHEPRTGGAFQHHGPFVIDRGK